MRRMIACLVLTSALTVAACDEPQQSNEPEMADTTVDAPVAPAVEGAAVPVTEPSAEDTAVDSTTLSPEQRSSEESVKPESETLFY